MKLSDCDALLDSCVAQPNNFLGEDAKKRPRLAASRVDLKERQVVFWHQKSPEIPSFYEIQDHEEAILEKINVNQGFFEDLKCKDSASAFYVSLHHVINMEIVFRSSSLLVS